MSVQSDLRERVAAHLWSQFSTVTTDSTPDYSMLSDFHKDTWRIQADRILALLSPGDAPARRLEWGLSERQDAVNILRQVCDDHGDNDWPDDLHLGDVIERHLWRNLGEGAGSPKGSPGGAVKCAHIRGDVEVDGYTRCIYCQIPMEDEDGE